MNINQIKNILSGDVNDTHELDLILSMEHLMSKHRSVFLDQKVFDMSQATYKILKSNMIKALNVHQTASGDLLHYYLIPISVRSLGHKDNDDVVDNIDAATIKSALVKSGMISDEALFSNHVYSRRTLFGGNVYNIFDTTRNALKPQESCFIDADILRSESENEHLFYVVFAEIAELSNQDDELWFDTLKFLQSRISKCCNADVVINPPKTVSDEMYGSFFSDAWFRLSDELSLITLSSVSATKLYVDENLFGSLYFYVDTECLAVVELGSLSNICLDDLTLKLDEFSNDYSLFNLGVEHLECDNGVKSRLAKTKNPHLKLIK